MKLPAPEILATPAWADVAGALRKARTIDCEENDFAVGVCDAEGVVIGAALLRCYKQVSRVTSTVLAVPPRSPVCSLGSAVTRSMACIRRLAASFSPRCSSSMTTDQK